MGRSNSDETAFHESVHVLLWASGKDYTHACHEELAVARTNEYSAETKRPLRYAYSDLLLKHTLLPDKSVFNQGFSTDILQRRVEEDVTLNAGCEGISPEEAAKEVKRILTAIGVKMEESSEQPNTPSHTPTSPQPDKPRSPD
jgi:hypothetical protein